MKFIVATGEIILDLYCKVLNKPKDLAKFNELELLAYYESPNVVAFLCVVITMVSYAIIWRRFFRFDKDFKLLRKSEYDQLQAQARNQRANFRQKVYSKVSATSIFNYFLIF